MCKNRFQHGKKNLASQTRNYCSERIRLFSRKKSRLPSTVGCLFRFCVLFFFFSMLVQLWLLAFSSDSFIRVRVLMHSPIFCHWWTHITFEYIVCFSPIPFFRFTVIVLLVFIHCCCRFLCSSFCVVFLYLLRSCDVQCSVIIIQWALPNAHIYIETENSHIHNKTDSRYKQTCKHFYWRLQQKTEKKRNGAHTEKNQSHKRCWKINANHALLLERGDIELYFFLLNFSKTYTQ